ncbi:MAG: cytochrome c3 family protein [Acidobacteriota bacterium]
MFILFGSCSVEKNRKILSVFFDGVPEKKNPEDTDKITRPEKSVTKRRQVPKSIIIISHHPDHKKRSCNKCHSRSSSNFLVTEKKKLCFTCHKKEKFDGKFIHGPVAVQACTACHDPHKSKNRKLLLADGKELCLLCHKVPLMGPRYPCKGDVCTDCHEPHVASNKYFLKKDIKRTDNRKNPPDKQNL